MFYVNALFFACLVRRDNPSKSHMSRRLLQLVRVHAPGHRDIDRVICACHLVPESWWRVQCISWLEIHHPGTRENHPSGRVSLNIILKRTARISRSFTLVCYVSVLIF